MWNLNDSNGTLEMNEASFFQRFCGYVCKLIIWAYVVDLDDFVGRLFTALTHWANPYSKNNERTFCFAIVYTWISFALFEV